MCRVETAHATGRQRGESLDMLPAAPVHCICVWRGVARVRVHVHVVVRALTV